MNFWRGAAFLLECVASQGSGMSLIQEHAVLDALVEELGRQGQGGRPNNDPNRLISYPIKGTIDVVALAEAVENALRGARELWGRAG